MPYKLVAVIVLETGLALAAGVPEIAPVPGLIERPVGKVLADQVSAKPAFGMEAV